MKPFLSSHKVRRWLILMSAIFFVLFAFSISYPMAQRSNTTKVVGEAAQLISTTLTHSLSHYSMGELKKIRTQPDSPSSSFENINGLLTTTADALDCTRIFAVYKGVGGKYYYLLDSRFQSNVPASSYNKSGDPIDTDYLRHKSILDKLTTKTLSHSYGNTIIPTPYGSAVMAWSVLADHNGEVVGILGVQCDPGNTAFSKLGIVNLTHVAWFSGLVVLAGCGLLYYSFRHPAPMENTTMPKASPRSQSLREIHAQLASSDPDPLEETPEKEEEEPASQS